MANFINKYQTTSAYDADSTKEYPNTSLVNGVVVYKMERDFGGLTVVYNVVDPTQEVTLFQGGGSSSSGGDDSGSGGTAPATMNVDGVDETVVSTWRFETAGLHTVKYTFASDSMNVKFAQLGEITDVTIGSDITEIANFAEDNGAFQICGNLTSVTIDDSVTYIGNNAFDQSGITSVTIPSNLTSIGGYAFYYCDDLAGEITLPSSISAIGEGAFFGCTGLTSITVEATTPPTIGADVFALTTCPIYVPAESVAAYKAATNWSDFESQIQAIPSGNSEPEPAHDSPL